MHVKDREEIKTLILICRARGYNPRQTTEYVNRHLKRLGSDKNLSQSYIQRTIEQTRHDASEWLKIMVHGKYEYIDMFKTIIERLQVAQNELWDLVDARKEEGGIKKDYVLIKAYAEIHSINRTLWDLFKDIPMLMPGSASKTIDSIVFEDTTSVYPKLSA